MVVGTSIPFTVSNAKGASYPLNVTAGTCALLEVTLIVGESVTIQESIPAGFTITQISVGVPATLASSDLASGSAVVVIGAGTNVVLFEQWAPTGQVQLCKIAGAGVAAGTTFPFTASVVTSSGSATISGTIAAGTCLYFADVPVGAEVTVQEPPTSGFRVSAIAASDAGVLVSSDLTTGIAVLRIGGTGFNTVSFTNDAT